MAEYVAYANCMDLLQLRGIGANKIEEDEFRAYLDRMSPNGNPKPENWQTFARTSGNYPVDKIIFGMISGGIDAEKGRIIDGFIQQKSTGTTLPYMILIYSGDLQSTPKKELLNYARQKITRKEFPTFRNATLELFSIEDLQINPLKFALQPTMRLLSNAETLALKKSLVSVIPEKEKPLEELLPILTFEGRIATWYGAFVDDVFFFHRSLEGDQAYYRVVRPGPPKVKGKGFKFSSME